MKAENQSKSKDTNLRTGWWEGGWRTLQGGLNTLENGNTLRDAKGHTAPTGDKLEVHKRRSMMVGTVR